MLFIVATTLLMAETVLAFENIAIYGHATSTDSWNVHSGADKAIDGKTYPARYSGGAQNSVQV